MLGTAVNKLFTADGNVYFRLQLGAQHIPHPKHGGMLPGWARCVNRWYICVTVCAKRSDGPERRPLEGARMRHQRRPCRRPLRPERAALALWATPVHTRQLDGGVDGRRPPRFRAGRHSRCIDVWRHGAKEIPVAAVRIPQVESDREGECV